MENIVWPTSKRLAAERHRIFKRSVDRASTARVFLFSLSIVHSFIQFYFVLFTEAKANGAWQPYKHQQWSNQTSNHLTSLISVVFFTFCYEIIWIKNFTNHLNKMEWMEQNHRASIAYTVRQCTRTRGINKLERRERKKNAKFTPNDTAQLSWSNEKTKATTATTAAVGCASKNLRCIILGWYWFYGCYLGSMSNWTQLAFPRLF